MTDPAKDEGPGVIIDYSCVRSNLEFNMSQI